MDPYLEAPEVWPDVHTRLMNVFAEQLSPRLAPKYVAELTTQIVIDRVPDDPTEPRYFLPDVTLTKLREAGPATLAEPPSTPTAVRLRVPVAVPTRLVSIHIRHRESEKVVTVIELLSPVNKRPGEGRDEYLKKRQTLLDSSVHLVEIDLLRVWPRMPLGGQYPPADYLVMVSKAHERPECDVWPIRLHHALPSIPIPLLRPDPDVMLDMGLALRTAYERARYDLRINYALPPNPPLTPEQAEWAKALMSA
jgi:hypothetical protein